MPHRTLSTRNDYERKINYDWICISKINTDQNTFPNTQHTFSTLLLSLGDHTSKGIWKTETFFKIMLLLSAILKKYPKWQKSLKLFYHFITYTIISKYVYNCQNPKEIKLLQTILRSESATWT